MKRNVTKEGRDSYRDSNELKIDIYCKLKKKKKKDQGVCHSLSYFSDYGRQGALQSERVTHSHDKRTITENRFELFSPLHSETNIFSEMMNICIYLYTFEKMIY